MNIRFSVPLKVFILSMFLVSVAIVTVSFAERPPEEKTVASVSGEELNSAAFYEKIKGSSKALFKVERLSCSGCVDNIKKALSGFEGIKEIFVDVSVGKAEIYFDNKKLKDMSQIATAITGAGYPAKLDKIIPADQVEKELDVFVTRSQVYVASVGDMDISRDELDNELEYAKKQYVKKYGADVFASDRGKALLENLKGQITARLINDGIQRQEIRKAGFKVDKGTVKKEYREFLAKKGMTSEAFKSSLEKNGSSYERFMKKFEFRVLVSEYLDSEILSGTSNEYEKQQRYFEWFNNTKLLAKVVFYDKALEQLVQNGSSVCGGGGGCSGGGCAASRGKK
jgi:copper chaperone CopZ